MWKTAIGEKWRLWPNKCFWLGRQTTQKERTPCKSLSHPSPWSISCCLWSPPTCLFSSSGRSGESWLRYTVFSKNEITPATTDKFERRLERFFRELARLVFQWTLRNVEASDARQTASAFDFEGERYSSTKPMVSTESSVARLSRNVAMV